MSEKTQNSEPSNQDPFIFDNNWGNWGKLPQDANRLTTTNADGEPVVSLTEEQKFVFESVKVIFVFYFINCNVRETNIKKT